MKAGVVALMLHVLVLFVLCLPGLLFIALSSHPHSLKEFLEALSAGFVVMYVFFWGRTIWRQIDEKWKKEDDLWEAQRRLKKCGGAAKQVEHVSG